MLSIFTKTPLSLQTPERREKALDIFTLLILLGTWAFTMYVWSQMPNIIALHFNGHGRPDSFGGKTSIFMMPAVCTLLVLILTFVHRFPGLFNFAIAQSGDESESRSFHTKKLVRFIRLAIIVTAFLEVASSYLTASGILTTLSNWFLPLTLGLTVLPIVLYFIHSSGE